MKSPTKTFLIIPALCVVAIIFAIYLSKQTGTVSVTSNLVSTKGETVTFNGKTYSTNGKSFSYKLHRGNYQVKITVPGYQAFSSQFSLKTDQNIIVNASINLGYTPSISNISQIDTGNQSLSNSQLVGVDYFYSNLWAVVTLTADGENGVLVAEYSPAAKEWGSIVGPGTLFTPDSVDILPTLIQSYLINQGYVNGEGN
jgi:hypothetical protein